MRRLLVKLVAIETALVGWLAYWLFLVYANNPGITDQLAGNLARFPQLSFSTIDIAILVIIAGLAIALAFKFQKGLRPGIRLERALQMLENLMKRNLVLEAQVAELKIEKTHAGPMSPFAQPGLSSTEPRAGSWEKAFRTPLEAGPPAPARSSSMNDPESGFERGQSVSTSRLEPKQPVLVPTASSNFSPRSPTIAGRSNEKPGSIVSLPIDKQFEKPITPSSSTPTTPSSWEDSPKFTGESKGILNPSPAQRKIPTVSESGGVRQPYIPSPAPKTVPPSVILGPMSSTPAPQARTSAKVPATVQASPRSSLSPPSLRPAQTLSKPPAPGPIPGPTPSLTPKVSEDPDQSKPSSTATNTMKPTNQQPAQTGSSGLMKAPTVEKPADTTKPSPGGLDSEGDKPDYKSDVKSSRPSKRKFSYEEE